MSDEAKVLTEVRGRTLVITMNRPEARNAVNGDVASGIEAAIDELENNEELWTAVLTGNGPVFCAGADLKAISSGNAAGLQTERGGFGGFVQRKRTKPVIAALNGPALAGGCELAISCDLIVAPEGGKIGIPEVKRSLIALAGGLVRLPRLLGKNAALELAMTGEPFPVERMYQLGLVNRVVPADQVLSTALELADKINEAAPLAVRASRQVILESDGLDEEAAFAKGGELVGPVFRSEDFSEGPLAFIEKRAPNWKAK
ncbi:MAG: crotonase/enoyl-CoA hydratase family protein [Candidatus Binatia bacterium]|nr:crotonase/enoyl-CoA hydratase family protein [Candidatus Binatia bacterium]